MERNEKSKNQNNTMRKKLTIKLLKQGKHAVLVALPAYLQYIKKV